MAQCCYGTHRLDCQNFPKIDAVSTFAIIPWEYERDNQPISHAAREFAVKRTQNSFLS